METIEHAAPIANGIYRGVPFRDYLAWQILSQSVLKEGRESMSHLKAALDGDRVKVQTDDMILGSALHTAFLEPARMLDHVVLWEGGSRRGKGWEEFQEANAHKAILTPGYHENLIGMVDALRAHPFVRQWSGRMDATEVSAVGEIEGVRVKGRCDALTADPLVDLKKVTSTDPRAVSAAVIRFGYHIQAFIYRTLFKRDRFVLVCVEGQPPYDVVPFELSATFLRLGMEEACSLLQRYRFCLESGEWPGRSNEVVPLEPPEWMVGDEDVAGITVDGEHAF